MLDFIKAALPWVIIGLSVAICISRLSVRKAKEDDGGNKKNKNEVTNTYMFMGMCIGMGIGMIVGKYLYDNIATGMCIGMCCGLMIGSSFPMKSKQASK